MDFGETIIALTAILIGGTIILFPLGVLAIRFAAKPLLEAWSRARESPLADERIQLLERRLSLLQERVDTLETEHALLTERTDFHLQLGRPK